MNFKFRFFLTALFTTLLCLTTYLMNGNAAVPTTISQAQPASRIVALTSTSADILQQLDSKKLVGISGSSLFTEDARFANIPIVSSGRTPPNLEKIIALKPDLVIGAVGFHNQTLAKMKQLGIRTISTDLNSWSDLESLIRELAFNVGTASKPVSDRLQSCAINSKSSAPSTLVLVSRQPLLSPNRESWAGSLLERFKVKNVTAELQQKSPIGGYVTLSAERILQSNPDSIILVDTPTEDVTQFKTLPFWQQLKAVKSDRIYTFDYYGLVNPGSIGKIEQACKQIKNLLVAS